MRFLLALCLFSGLAMAEDQTQVFTQDDNRLLGQFKAITEFKDDRILDFTKVFVRKNPKGEFWVSTDDENQILEADIDLRDKRAVFYAVVGDCDTLDCDILENVDGEFFFRKVNGKDVLHLNITFNFYRKIYDEEEDTTEDEYWDETVTYVWEKSLVDQAPLFEPKAAYGRLKKYLDKCEASVKKHPYKSSRCLQFRSFKFSRELDNKSLNQLLKHVNYQNLTKQTKLEGESSDPKKAKEEVRKLFNRALYSSLKNSLDRYLLLKLKGKRTPEFRQFTSASFGVNRVLKQLSYDRVYLLTKKIMDNLNYSRLTFMLVNEKARRVHVITLN